jgi:hypothetical protein
LGSDDPAFRNRPAPIGGGNNEYQDASSSRRRQDGALMVEQTDFIRDILHRGPELSAFPIGSRCTDRPEAAQSMTGHSENLVSKPPLKSGPGTRP